MGSESTADENSTQPLDDEAEEPSNARQRLIRAVLARIPEAAVSLGAGFLFASSLISLLLTAIVGYSVIVGEYPGALQQLRSSGVPPILVGVQTFFVTAFQAIGTYFALKRTHWGTVLLACLLGSLLLITIPFILPAFVLLSLGKRHFRIQDGRHSEE